MCQSSPERQEGKKRARSRQVDIDGPVDAFRDLALLYGECDGLGRAADEHGAEGQRRVGRDGRNEGEVVAGRESRAGRCAVLDGQRGVGCACTEWQW